MRRSFMVKRSKAETEKFYRGLLAEQSRSGRSLRAFAATRGIPAGTLSSWRHQLKRRDADRASRKDKAAEARFVPVVVGARVPESPRPTTNPAIYEVVLGHDRVLRLPADFDDTRVAALVRVVASC
jgi:transposase-like protein